MTDRRIDLSKLRRIETVHASLVVAVDREARSSVEAVVDSAAVAIAALVSLVVVLDDSVW